MGMCMHTCILCGLSVRGSYSISQLNMNILNNFNLSKILICTYFTFTI